jgi:hypothetical protein
MDPMQTNQPDPSTPPTSPGERLRALEQRLDRVSATAERLLGEALGARAGAPGAGAPGAGAPGARAGAHAGDAATRRTQSKLPPAGFQPPGGHAAAERGLESLLELIRALRELISPELQRRLVEALRELLAALRALIDHCIEALERSTPRRAQIRDIPIL